ncbi:conserved exported hypothetical protein [Candidatus Terasakiella magnetica]|nr:conserved exported hypothetical protein [Candidatus Terasakiella magnetica]
MTGILRVLALASLACFCGGGISPVMAQQGGGVPQGTADVLPPALQAAVNAGNPQAIRQAIATLSGGNPARALGLAEGVVHAAERLLTANPQVAVQLAAVALETARVSATANAAASQEVISAVARVIVSPASQRVAPDATAALATNVVQAASASNSSALVASVSVAAVSLAEKMLASNPSAAVALAGATVAAVKTQAVLTSAPGQSLDVISTAARIIVTPEAQRVSPAACAQASVSISAIASDRGVYAANPNAAMQAMASSYATVSSASVRGAVPDALGTVVGTLNQAAANVGLNQANPATGTQIGEILTNRYVFTKPPEDRGAIPPPPVITDGNKDKVSPS